MQEGTETFSLRTQYPEKCQVTLWRRHSGRLRILYGQAILSPHSPHVVMKPLSLHWDEGVPYPQQQ